MYTRATSAGCSSESHFVKLYSCNKQQLKKHWHVTMHFFIFFKKYFFDRLQKLIIYSASEPSAQTGCTIRQATSLLSQRVHASRQTTCDTRQTTCPSNQRVHASRQPTYNTRRTTCLSNQRVHASRQSTYVFRQSTSYLR